MNLSSDRFLSDQVTAMNYAFKTILYDTNFTENRCRMANFLKSVIKNLYCIIKQNYKMLIGHG